VVFVSDAITELQAANTAGMQVVFSDREGNPQRDPGHFMSVSRLDHLILKG
jgi:enolase-phosphatase E1